MQDDYMRTTLTLDPDVAERLKQHMRTGKQSLKDAVNETLRRGLGLQERAPRVRFEVRTHDSPFVPGVDASRLNQIVDELEAEAVVSRVVR